MASPFKIPKKKQMSAADSAPLHASPLSRLQSPAPNLKGYEGGFSRGGADSVHAGSRLSTPSRPFFRDYVKTLLGIKSPSGGTPAANQRGCGGQRAESLSNGRWRPKRASDRLLQPASPPQKKKTQLSGSSARRISVTSCDSLAELRGEEHAGSLSPWPEGERSWRREESGRRDAVERKSDAGSSPEPLNQQQKKKSPASGSDQDSEDVFTFPSRNKPSSTSLRTPAGEGRGQGRSLERAPLLTASGLMEERREKERERWREFREKKKKNRSAVLQPRPKKPKQTPTEPSESNL
ncbi:uncharacterized protein LOC121962839 [Plectropomus leopardus]|uniref:uncharacterized protein LOC121962839 n=1 Tax=Plectropomus leopardus TaxID=160734 RepID=UPI001C4B851E|nr:uncharacterized protein LOC121962839 [Plectropomus leopardus]